MEKINKGYTYTSTADGKALRSVEQVEEGDRLKICVTDGFVEAGVLSCHPVQESRCCPELQM